MKMNPNLSNYLYNKLNLERRAQDWTWGKLAKEINIHHSVFKRLKENKPVSVRSLQKINAWLGPDVEKGSQLIALLQQPKITEELASVFHEFWSKQAAVSLKYGAFDQSQIGQQWLDRLSRTYDELLLTEGHHQRKCQKWADKALETIVNSLK